jgi:hypothetical protein
MLRTSERLEDILMGSPAYSDISQTERIARPRVCRSLDNLTLDLFESSLKIRSRLILADARFLPSFGFCYRTRSFPPI